MYEIATVCLDNFTNAELSKIYYDSGYAFRIMYAFNNVNNLLKQSSFVAPDIAIIDCNNAGEQTAEAVKFLRNKSDFTNIIVIGDSSKPENSKIFAHLLSEKISRFYEKAAFLTEFMNDLDAIREEIDQSQEQAAIKNEAMRLRSSVLMNSLLGNYYTLDNPAFSKGCNYKDRLMTFEAYYNALIGISIESDYSENKSAFMLRSKLLLSSAADFFGSRYDAIVNSRPNYYSINVLMKSPHGNDPISDEEVYNSCVEFVKYINSNSGFKINIGLSSRYTDLNKIPFCFNESSAALSFMSTFSETEGLVLRWSDARLLETLDYNYLQKLKNNIMTSLMSKDIDVIEDAINSSIDSVLNRRYHPYVLSSIIESIVDSCLTVFEDSIVPFISEFQAAFGIDGFAYKMSDAKEIKKLLKQKISLLINSDVDADQQKSSSLINRIKKSVEHNFSDPKFTVEQIANDMLMNYSYICSAFKKETGSTINQYIKNHRMSRAVELIHSGLHDIPEIAENVGFSDVSYFSKCFKQYFGVTPKTYIKQQL